MLCRLLSCCWLLGWCCVAFAQDERLQRVVLLGESANASRRLEAARKLVAEKQWTEALEAYQQLLEDTSTDLIATSPLLANNVRSLCQQDMTGWPADVLTQYQKRVAPTTKRWLEQGLAERDHAQLQRLVREAFCSQESPLALDTLGDLAFEQGRFGEAMQWWKLLVGPVLAPADTKAVLRVPSTPTIDVARIKAKQVLACIFQGELAEAQQEVAEYARAYPQAEGRLAGRQGKYAELLRSLLSKPTSARWTEPTSTWGSYAGAPTRNRVLPSEPREAQDLARVWEVGPRWVFHLEKHFQLDFTAPKTPPHQVLSAAALSRHLAFHPTIVGSKVIVNDAKCVVAYDMLTGKSEVWHQLEDRLGLLQTSLLAPPDLRYTSTVSEGHLLVRLGSQELSDTPSDKPTFRESVLVCLRLEPGSGQQRLAWSLTLKSEEKNPHYFEGSPIVQDGKVCIALTRYAANQAITSIVCYPLQVEGTAPPQPIWRQDVCAIAEEKGPEPRRRQHLLTSTGNSLVYSSHSGAVVCLDLQTGERMWSRRYLSRGLQLTGDLRSPRDLAPAVSAHGRLFVAPADAASLLCLDPLTGEALWERAKLEVVQLLGVTQGKLFVTTSTGIRALAVQTGADARTSWGAWQQPEDGSALPSLGAGLLFENCVLWQTRAGLRVLSVDEARPLFDPVRTRQVPAGNLVYADGCLVVAGLEELSIFVAPARWKEPLEAQAQAQPKSPTAQYELGVAQLDAGEYTAARASFALVLKLLTGDEERVTLHQAAQEQWLAAALRQIEHARKYQPEQAPILQAEALRTAPTARAQLGVWASLPQADRPAEHEATLRKLAQAPEQRALFLPDGPVIRSAPSWFVNQVEVKPSANLPSASWAWPIQRIETEISFRQVKLLPTDTSAPPGSLLLAGRQVTYVTDTVRWQQTVSEVPTQALWLADTVLLVGADFVTSLELATGAPRWEVRAAELSSCRLAGGRLFCLQQGEILLALDARSGRLLWSRAAPGAKLYTQPGLVGFCAEYLATPDRVLVRTLAGRLWLLRADSGSRLAEFLPEDVLPGDLPTDTFVLGVDGRVCLAMSGERIACLALESGKIEWETTLSPTTGLAGRWPRLILAGGQLLVLITRNFAETVQILSLTTGRPSWPTEWVLGLTTLARGRLAADERRLYVASDSAVSAYDLTTRALAWRIPWTGPPIRELKLLHEALVVLPQADLLQRTQLHWGPIRLQWKALPSGRETDASLLVLDAKSGAWLQRLNLPSPGRSLLQVGPGWQTSETWQLLPRWQQQTESDSQLSVQSQATGLAVQWAGEVWHWSGVTPKHKDS